MTQHQPQELEAIENLGPYLGCVFYRPPGRHDKTPQNKGEQLAFDSVEGHIFACPACQRRDRASQNLN